MAAGDPGLSLGKLMSPKVETFVRWRGVLKLQWMKVYCGGECSVQVLKPFTQGLLHALLFLGKIGP